MEQGTAYSCGLACFSKGTTMNIRWMIRRDLQSVMLIEQISQLQPWSEDEMLNHLRVRNCIGMVAEEGDEIDGYMLYMLHKSELEVIRFSALDDRAAMAMLNKLQSKLCQQRRSSFSMCIPETEVGTLDMLCEQGMETCGIEWGAYGYVDGVKLRYERWQEA